MKLVRVVWDDAEDAEPKLWMDEEEVDKFSKETRVIESIGWLVSRTTKYVTLAGDWIEGLKHYGRVTKIPTGVVQSIEDIGGGKESEV